MTTEGSHSESGFILLHDFQPYGAAFAAAAKNLFADDGFHHVIRRSDATY